MIIIYDHHIWSLYLIIIYDHYIGWSSYMMIIYDDHIRWSYMMIIYGDHIWWSYMTGRGRGRGRNLLEIDIFSWKYHIFYKKHIFRVCWKCNFKAVCKKSLKTYQKYYRETKWTSPLNFWWKSNIYIYIYIHCRNITKPLLRGCFVIFYWHLYRKICIGSRRKHIFRKCRLLNKCK